VSEPTPARSPVLPWLLAAAVVLLRLGHWGVTGWALDGWGVVVPLAAVAALTLVTQRPPTPVAFGAGVAAVLIAFGLYDALAWMPGKGDGVTVSTADWGFAPLYIAGALEAALGVLIGGGAWRNK